VKALFTWYLYCMTIPGITPFRQSRSKATTHSTDSYIGPEATFCAPVGVVGLRFQCGTINRPSGKCKPCLAGFRCRGCPFQSLESVDARKWAHRSSLASGDKCVGFTQSKCAAEQRLYLLVPRHQHARVLHT
jgi:hypothetical protein